jgi:hypothetical protein
MAAFRNELLRAGTLSSITTIHNLVTGTAKPVGRNFQSAPQPVDSEIKICGTS